MAGVLQPEEETFLDTWMDMETGLEVTRQLILILQIFFSNHLIIRSTLTLDIEKEDDKSVLSCEVSHPSLGHPLWVKAMLNVGCMYEPKFNLFLICKIFKSIKVSEDMF